MDNLALLPRPLPSLESTTSRAHPYLKPAHSEHEPINYLDSSLWINYLSSHPPSMICTAQMDLQTEWSNCKEILKSSRNKGWKPLFGPLSTLRTSSPLESSYRPRIQISLLSYQEALMARCSLIWPGRGHSRLYDFKLEQLPSRFRKSRNN